MMTPLFSKSKGNSFEYSYARRSDVTNTKKSLLVIGNVMTMMSRQATNVYVHKYFDTYAYNRGNIL